MYISNDQLIQIQQAIESSICQPDGWTIFLSIASTAVAIIAVIVSICTAKTQNKIALYERRLTCYQQFCGLQAFANFIEKLENPAVDNDTISQYQQKYLDIHNLLVDEEFQKYRFDPTRRNVYVWNCLEKDRYFITSVSFLLRHIDEKELEALESAITKFIVELFRLPEETNIKKITETKDFFVGCFSKMKCAEAELKTTLRIK